MKATSTLHNLTDSFYADLQLLTPSDQFSKLNKLRIDLPHCIKLKIGNDSFRDRVDLNSLMKRTHTVTSKIEPRRGYKLMTFNFEETK
jgi:hypothetical protein